MLLLMEVHTPESGARLPTSGTEETNAVSTAW